MFAAEGEPGDAGKFALLALLGAAQLTLAGCTRKFGPLAVRTFPGKPGTEFGLAGREAYRKTGAETRVDAALCEERRSARWELVRWSDPGSSPPTCSSSADHAATVPTPDIDAFLASRASRRPRADMEDLG